MSIKSFQVFNGFAKTSSVSENEMAGSRVFGKIHAKNQLEFGFFEESFLGIVRQRLPHAIRLVRSLPFHSRKFAAARWRDESARFTISPPMSKGLAASAAGTSLFSISSDYPIKKCNRFRITAKARAHSIPHYFAPKNAAPSRSGLPAKTRQHGPCAKVFANNCFTKSGAGP